jgi:hypothetical protein
MEGPGWRVQGRSQMLTSSTHRSAFDEEIDSFEFIAKADICAERIRQKLT